MKKGIQVFKNFNITPFLPSAAENIGVAISTDRQNDKPAFQGTYVSWHDKKRFTVSQEVNILDIF